MDSAHRFDSAVSRVHRRGHLAFQSPGVLADQDTSEPAICAVTRSREDRRSGDATDWATNYLNASISDNGSVNDYGRPSISTFGSGSDELKGLNEKNTFNIRRRATMNVDCGRILDDNPGSIQGLMKVMDECG